jgi:carbon-monoxide dehydrogenase small subunit
VEGLARNGKLHPLQQAFIDGFAAQCGFCTPGMILVAKALLDRNPEPSCDDVMDAISGNICRCTGYEPIVNAILKAAEVLRGGAPQDADPARRAS